MMGTFKFMSRRHGATSECGCRNGLQIGRIAGNILKNKSRTAEKE
jgi:hypothetical protein